MEGLFAAFGGFWWTAVTFVAAYLVFRFTKKWEYAGLTVLASVVANKFFGADNTDAKKQNRIESDLDKVSKEKEASYLNSQYDILADKLEEAFFDWGTDDEAVDAVMKKIKNDADFLKLYSAFGKRPYTGGILPNVEAVFGFAEGDELSKWMVNELSTAKIDEINASLKKRGLTLSF